MLISHPPAPHTSPAKVKSDYVISGDLFCFCFPYFFSLASQYFMAVKQDVLFPGTANLQVSTFSVLYVFLHNN